VKVDRNEKVAGTPVTGQQMVTEFKCIAGITGTRISPKSAFSRCAAILRGDQKSAART